MIVGGIYSFNQGKEVVEAKYAKELAEIIEVIQSVDAVTYKTKISEEKTMPGKLLFRPSGLNRAFKSGFVKEGWDASIRVQCDYPTEFYTSDYAPPSVTQNAFREMDFVKNRLGVEVQFGKYAFMVYNVCAKMTIFHNEGFIDAGVEIVPLKELASDMSSGVSYFEQFVWDLEHRGVSDIDIPVLILGLAAG
ncbi:MAG: restriction endonuclease [Ardenticatenaceae bacterium]|nr:restriction endonuclease [Ardenticatenaceae bacterium]